jgi:hypothetical protein
LTKEGFMTATGNQTLTEMVVNETPKCRFTLLNPRIGSRSKERFNTVNYAINSTLIFLDLLLFDPISCL